jgi:hypothetical protein
MSVVTRALAGGDVARLRLPALPRAREHGESAADDAAAERSGDAGTATASAGWVVQNLTPRPVWLEHGGRVFTLGPLEERRWPPRTGPGATEGRPPWAAFPDLERLVERHQIDIRRPPRTPEPDHVRRASARAFAFVAFFWLASYWPLSTWWWQRIGGVVGVGAGLGLLWLLTRPRRQPRSELRRWSSYNAVMLLVVAIGVLMPAGALYLATDLHEIVSVWPNGFSIDTSQPLVLIGRLMQLTFIAVATLLPALMYFQFDAERLGTMRDRWMQNVFRLDPTVSTACDVTAKYGRQLEEAYGSPDDGRGRLTRGRRSPIICTTLILAFGWLLILLKAGDRIADGPDPGTGISFISLLDPSPSLVTYAFLGAYFFGLQLVWQGYLRADLRPKTYTTITVRVLIVVVLAWLMDATLGFGESPGWLYALAFTAGFVPDSVLHLVWERASPGMSRLVDGDRRLPLTELEGIDLYERTRLSEEGITSVEALAHHDLLDLFFKTRISAARLVDWVDQAVLVMHLGAEPDPPEGEGRTLRRALRGVGIRTASDLVDLTRRPDPSDPVGYERSFELLLETVRAALPEASRTNLRQRLMLIAAALDHSEWIGRIETWRRSDLIEADPLKRTYIGAGGERRRGDPRADVLSPRRIEV